MYVPEELGYHSPVHRVRQIDKTVTVGTQWLGFLACLPNCGIVTHKRYVPNFPTNSVVSLRARIRLVTRNDQGQGSKGRDATKYVPPHVARDRDGSMGRQHSIMEATCLLLTSTIVNSTAVPFARTCAAALLGFRIALA